MAVRYNVNSAPSRIDLTHPRPFLTSTASPPDTSSFVRPLSDIREITEPSIAEIGASRPPTERQASGPSAVARQRSLRQASTFKRVNSVRIVEPSKGKGKQQLEARFSSSTASDDPIEGTSSPYRIPAASVPPRASSRNLPATGTFTIDGHSFPAVPRHIPDRGHSDSPVRQIGDQTNPVDSRRAPSQTVVRSPCPFAIVDQPNIRHPRLSAHLQIVAPLFVGGGSIEGFAQVAVDNNESARHKRGMLISRIAVDLLGIEELVGQHRRSVFLSLGTELLTSEYPPPDTMVESTIPLSYRDPHWILRPSITALPFRLSLPLDVGSAPFRSKTARIRYLLGVSVHFTNGGRAAVVRSSQDVTVLSTYDPERALRSLPSPLTAFDEIHMAKSGHVEVIRLTAGLHRQVWVSGTSIFVDVHVANNSRKALKRLEVSIERDTLYYKHSAASTLERSASQARIFENKEQAMLSKTSLKLGQSGWNGVGPHSNVIRTCNVDIPRGHATVRCGKFFEVRYFLNVTISTSHVKLLSVQLPIILIHMNSLDVVPNAVGQVSIAIEAKRAQHYEAQARKTSQHSSGEKGNVSSRSRTRQSGAPARHKQRKPQSIQGRAFAAPRSQSLDRMKAQAADIQRLEHELDQSPRKYAHRRRRDADSPGKHHRPEVPPKDRRPHSPPPDQYQQHHKFALHNSSSQHSLGGLSGGSYTVLNGRSAAVNNITADHASGIEAFQQLGLTDTVRRTMRNMRSFDTFRGRPPGQHHSPQSSSRSPMDQDGATDSRPAHSRVQMQPSMLGLSDPNGNFSRSVHPRSILKAAATPTHASPTRGRQHRIHGQGGDTYGGIYNARIDDASAPRSRSALPFIGGEASGLVRRASLRLRDSFDRGRFELQAAVKQPRGVLGGSGGSAGAGATVGAGGGIGEGIRGLWRKGREVVEGSRGGWGKASEVQRRGPVDLAPHAFGGGSHRQGGLGIGAGVGTGVGGVWKGAIQHPVTGRDGWL